MTGRRGYYWRAAVAAGVPPFWLQDAVQDIALRVWRARRDDSLVVRRAAVDAARRYGQRSRRRVRRETARLEAAASIVTPDPAVQVCALLDLRVALGRLTARQRRGLAASLRGRPTNLETVHAAAARRQLRRLCGVR